MIFPDEGGGGGGIVLIPVVEGGGGGGREGRDLGVLPRLLISSSSVSLKFALCVGEVLTNTASPSPSTDSSPSTNRTC